MSITYHFYQRLDKLRENGKAPIYLRITENRQSIYRSSGLFIKPKYWNKSKEKIRRSHPNYKSLNNILSNKKRDALEIQSDLSDHGKDSAKAIKERLKNQQTGRFFDLAGEYLQDLQKDKRLYAIKNCRVVLKKIKTFEQGSRTLPLKSIDTKWLEDFERFLKIEYDNKPTTINKNFEPVRAVIRKALQGHLIAVDPFINFDGAKRGKAKSKTKLTIEQIQAIETLPLQEGSKLWHTRNYFMFSFYSGGIRFGDMCCLLWKNIKGNRLVYQMNKNKKDVSGALNSHQETILNHYKPFTLKDDFIFPLLDNHVDYSDPIFLRKRIGSKNVLVNKWLKEIAQKVNQQIKENGLNVPELAGVSFHVARHSFSQHAVEQGLSMYELMQMLRHSNIQTTQQYLKGLDEELFDKAMNKVF